jgi:site-specific DNA recombinase
MKRAVIYARVSTNGQKDNYSFATQRADCERYAAQHGFEIIRIFAESKSGRTLERDDLQSLRDMVKERAIDVVLVGKLDRLSRKVAQLSLIAEECHKAGVELHYADFGKDENTPMGRMIRNMRASYAEFEVDLIVDRLQSGRHTKIVGSEKAPPRISGHGKDAPYGYRYEGLKADKQLIIHDEEGPTIVDIFTWYVSGMKVAHMQEKLTTMRVPLPSTSRVIKSAELVAAHAKSIAPDGDPKYRPNPAGMWSRSTIYKILRNPVYRGEFMHYRKKDGSYATDPATWIGVKVPAIVSEELFAAAQARLAEGRAMSQRRCKKEYLLRCRIRCACGYACGGMPGNDRSKRGYYECYSRREEGRKCADPYTRAGDVDDAVWEWIETIVLDEENLREGLRQQQETAQAERAKLDETRERYLQQRLDLEQEAILLMRLFTKKLYTIEQVSIEKQRIDGAIQAVSHELAGVEQRLAGLTISPQEMDELTAFATEVRRKLADLTFASKRRVVDLLDTRVVLKMVDGQQYADVTCKLTLDQETVAVESSSRQVPKGTAEPSTVSTPYSWAPRRQSSARR